jgi:hypothetical protein
MYSCWEFCKLNVCLENFARASLWKNAGSVLAAIKQAGPQKKTAISRRGLKNPLCRMSFRATLKRLENLREAAVEGESDFFSLSMRGCGALLSELAKPLSILFCLRTSCSLTIADL